MKTNIFIFSLSLLAVLATSCVVVTNEPGPPGRPGNAFFAVDFEDFPPYSYWDNNPVVPYNPELGYYFLTNVGYFEFEYFINPYEYYYGSYEIFRNPGGPGGPYGEPGYNGSDTYLRLICDPHGFHMHGTSYKSPISGEQLVIKGDNERENYVLKIRRTTVQERHPKGDHKPY